MHTPFAPRPSAFEPLEPRVLLSSVDLLGGPPTDGQYIVTLHDEVDPLLFAQDMEKLGGKVQHVFSSLNGLVLRGLSPMNDDRVAYVEPDFQVNASGQFTPLSISRIGADQNATAAIAGDGGMLDIDVAVLDTGVDQTHPDLNVAGGANFVSDDIDAWQDGNGHGTHVAGTIAALDNDLGVVGVAPGSRIWALRVLDDTGSGTLSGIIAGIDYVTANADIFEIANMSLSGIGYSPTAHAAIQRSVEAGVVYIVAAGNDGQDIYGGDGIFGTADDVFPAALPEVAAISALTDTDGQPGGLGGPTGSGNDDSLASFSNFAANVVDYNPVTSPGGAIDLTLPGVNIASTYLDGGYAYSSGTSMAAPHAAGLAALHIAEFGRDLSPGDGINQNDVYAIRQALIDQAAPADSPEGYSTAGDRDSYREPVGYARVSSPQVFDLAITSLTANPDALLVGEATQLQVVIQNNSTQSATFDLQLNSDNGTPDDSSDDFLVGTAAGITLSPGQQQWLTTDPFIASDQPGTVTYSASHNLTDDDPSNDFLSTAVRVDAPAPLLEAPEAVIKSRDFTLDDSDGDGVEQFRIGGSSSFDPDGEIVTRNWYLDGVYLNSKSTVQPVLAVGQYTLELEVIDNDGLSDRTSVVLEVVGQAISEPDPSAPDAQAPTAVIKSRDFTLVDHDGDGTERFRIGGSSSYDNDGNIVAKDWYLDGVYLNSKSTVQPTLSIGTYLLELEVTDNDGLTNRTSVTLEVLPDTSAATAGLSSMPGGNDVLLSSVGVLPVQSVEPFAPIAEHEAIDDQSHQKVSPSVSESSRRPSAAIAALLKTATDAILKHVEDPDAAPAGPSVPLRLANKVDDTQLRPAGLLGLLELSASLTLQEV